MWDLLYLQGCQVQAIPRDSLTTLSPAVEERWFSVMNICCDLPGAF
jgi:hypothetical protein